MLKAKPFASILQKHARINYQRPEVLADLIDAAHDEISILLGDEEWRIYYPD